MASIFLVKLATLALRSSSWLKLYLAALEVARLDLIEFSKELVVYQDWEISPKWSKYSKAYSGSLSKNSPLHNVSTNYFVFGVNLV